MNYQRFISYLYQYQGGAKQQNTGYVKVEQTLDPSHWGWSYGNYSWGARYVSTTWGLTFVD